MADRVPEPTESWALGSLYSILSGAGCRVEHPVDVRSRSLDVQGLVPGEREGDMRPTIRITIEEVR